MVSPKQKRQFLIYSAVVLLVLGGLFYGRSFKNDADRARWHKKLHWQQLALGSEGDKLSLQVSLKKIHRECFSGDWDAIESELKYSKDPVALLTLEVLGDDAKQPLVRKFTADDFKDVIQHTFVIPKDYGNYPLGLFICKDSTGTGRCQGDKAVIDIGDIIAKYAVPPRIDPAYAQSDKIYFFNHIVIHGAQLLTPAETKQTESYYDNMERYSSRYLKGNSQTKVTSTIKNLTDTLLSVPAEIVNNQMNIVLPALDPACIPFTPPSVHLPGAK